MFYKIPFTGEVYTECIQVLIAAVIVIVLGIAWWTTSIQDNWHVRTVYFFDARSRRSRHLHRLTNHTVSSTLVESTHTSVDSTQTESEAVGVSDSPEGSSEDNKPNSSENSEEASSTSSGNQEEEQTRIIQTMDADANMLRQRRIAFFEGRRDTLITATEEASSTIEPPSPDIIVETSDGSECSIMEHNYADRECVNDGVRSREAKEAAAGNSTEAVRNNIRIKLKYINDDLKLVDGRLEELLGDFKRRHFEEELSTNKLVKLIFNGQVLIRDNDTLQNYGLFDNCVVHCLIHHQRVNPNDENSNASSAAGNGNSRTSGGHNRDWDLGNLLIVLISFLLSSAWYFRYQYPQFFTVTATVALVTITVIFTVVSIGMYFPDPDPARPQTHIIR